MANHSETEWRAHSDGGAVEYGYKSIKSIVKIELVATQPKTLWESLAPDEYPFESNVNPNIPHPRWSQATERVVDTGKTSEYAALQRLR